MKTLIIHPADKSTDFLKPIYSDIKGATVVTGGISKDKVYDLINEHDRIMMMGHGSPWGLFSVGQFARVPESEYFNTGYIIDSTTVPLLQNKECIFIWCNADKFVHKHELKGLYSGMFISEVGEANYCGLPNTPQEVVDESNNFFAKEFGKVTAGPLHEAYQYIKYVYSGLAESNQVAEYNSIRLYLNK